MEYRKTRIAHFCNVKAVLLYMVIFGHLIEDAMRTQPLLEGVYRAIYMVHMPLFAFMAGMCSKDGERCAHSIGRLFACYACIQTAAALIGRLAVGQGDLLVPWWHTWFLLSLMCWRLLALAWRALERRCRRLGSKEARLALVLGSAALGCFAGEWEGVGRVMSLSRSIVFLPYFYLGLFLPEGTDFGRYREYGEIALAVALGMLYLLKDAMPVEFLYQAEGYAALGVRCGGLLRMACYVMAGLGGFALMTIVSPRRRWYTRFGISTLPVYLVHGPIVFLLRQLRLSQAWFALLAPLAAALVYYLLYRIFCDAGSNCRLVDGAGRSMGEIVPLWMRWI